MSQESAEAAVPRWPERSRLSTPQRSKSFTTSMTVLPTTHLFGHNGP
jgi:hypothetical protein